VSDCGRFKREGFDPTRSMSGSPAHTEMCGGSLEARRKASRRSAANEGLSLGGEQSPWKDRMP
jgi:hypothetical protein